jgi:hypothetical protein
MLNRCPRCGGTRFAVEAVIVIAWRGQSEFVSVDEMELRCSEAAVDEGCYVICDDSKCGWEGTVAELVKKE